MLHEILRFLMEVAVTLVGGACVLRLWMRWLRMPLAQPLGRFALALTDWLTLPLQRLAGPGQRLDTASLLAVWLLKLAQLAVLMALAGLGRWSALPVAALLGVAQLALSTGTAVLVVAALLSWTGQQSWLADVFGRLSAPLLQPLRRWVRPVGGVDLTPLLLIVLFQVLGMVLGAAMATLLGLGSVF